MPSSAAAPRALPCLALALALAVAASVALPATASAQTSWPAPTLQTPKSTAGTPLSQLKGGGAFGMGFAVGTVNGLSIKVWPARAHGFVINVGGFPPWFNALSVDGGYRFHFRPVGDDVTFQVTAGVAARFRLIGTSGAVYTEVGAGVPLGVSVLKSGLPAELFAEVVPTVVFHPVIGFDVAGLGGVRLYF